MIENGTFHVITTELVVGSFALAGLCFALHIFFTWRAVSYTHLTLPTNREV